MKRRRLIIGGACAWFAAGAPLAAEPPRPGPRDLCPVCGMLVAKYPHWAATLVWADGSAQHFDGAKDLFKGLQDLARYSRGRPAQDLREVFVTDFYTLERINARTAHYVVGSDVLGPMGHELVPLADRGDAEAFMTEHLGRSIVRFAEVTPALIRSLDAR